MMGDGDREFREIGKWTMKLPRQLGFVYSTIKKS
jgi:hypothetical protein